MNEPVIKPPETHARSRVPLPAFPVRMSMIAAPPVMIDAIRNNVFIVSIRRLYTRLVETKSANLYSSSDEMDEMERIILALCCAA